MGALKLLRLGVEQKAIAERLGCSAVLVNYWISGQRKPTARFRELISSTYGIGEDEFDRYPEPGASLAQRPTLLVDDASAAGGVYAMARQLEGMIRQQLDEVTGELQQPKDARDGTPLELAKLMSSLVPSLSHLAKLTGQYDLGRKLLSLPIWKRIESELSAALTPYPDAARAVAERFRRLEAEEGGAT